MKKYMLAAVSATVLGAIMLVISGCEPSTPTTPEEKTEKIARAIKLGTSTVTSIGLVAVPNADEASQIATLAAKVLDENVLPLLNGDEEAIVSGLNALLELKAFDDPRLEKVKLILETGLPLLESYLPEDLLEKPLDKMPADVKAYLKAFFEGARDGIANYQGGRGLKRGFKSGKQIDFAELRMKLNK